VADFRPTHSHPHRFCRVLHTIYSVAAVFALAGLSLEQPVMLLFLLPVCVIGAAVFFLVNGRSVSDVAREDAEATGPELVTRPVWGALAVCMDAVLVMVAFALIVALLQGGVGADLVPRGSASDYMGFVTTIALITGDKLAHRMAVRPATAETSPV